LAGGDGEIGQRVGDLPEFDREQTGRSQLGVHGRLGAVLRGKRSGTPTDEAVDQVVEVVTGGADTGEGIAGVAGHAEGIDRGGVECVDEPFDQLGGFWERPSFRAEVLVDPRAPGASVNPASEPSLAVVSPRPS
jgi:hypothetical protein